MRILICATGSHGDVIPFIALGRALQKRNCEVFILTHRYFQPRIQEHGLHCIGIGESAEEYQQLISDPQLTESHRGTKILAQAITANLAQELELLRSYVVPGRTVAIGSTLALLPRLLKQIDDVYCVTTHLAPVMLRCHQRLPRFGANHIVPRLPPPLPAFVWYLLDRLVFDPAFTPGLNALLDKLDLPPAKRVMGDWLHSGDLIMGLFPAWLANPQPPWPTPLRLTGFALDQGKTANAVNAELSQPGLTEQLGYDLPRQGLHNSALPTSIRSFLTSGPAPVVFTPGTATRCSAEFFRQSIAACQLAGIRGILVDAHGGAPQDLPHGVISSGYLPFAELLPHAAAVVHHGGIGTFSTALAAGIPQLIRPLAYDQFDNSSRARTLGVSLELLPRHYSGASAARAVKQLIDDPQRKETCRQIGERTRSENGAANAAEEVVKLAKQR